MKCIKFMFDRYLVAVKSKKLSTFHTNFRQEILTFQSTFSFNKLIIALFSGFFVHNKFNLKSGKNGRELSKSTYKYSFRWLKEISLYHYFKKYNSNNI